MAMSIIVVRHGETAGNSGRIVQLPETPLNERGLAQAALLARRLRDAGIRRVISSDLHRARMTAQLVCDVIGVTLEETHLLQERNFGDDRGTPYAELTQNIFAPGYAPPNGERWDEFDRRVSAAWSQVTSARREVDGPLLVVTHGLVCRSLAAHHLQLQGPVPEHWGNTSVTVVEAAAPHAAATINCTRHLDADAADDAGSISGI